MMDMIEERKRLLDELEKYGYIKSNEVKRAMLSIPRENFMPDHMEKYAYVDSPQPIGGGQTISAPHMVAMMVEKLDLEPGHKVLEVGGGMGYHAAVISRVVKEEGIVFSVELLEELARSAEKALEKTGIQNVEVIRGDGSSGYEEEAPYDRISVACAAPEIPPPLIRQLKVGGKLLLPVSSGFFQELIRVTRTAEDKIKKEKLGGVAFVPLKGEYGY
ncbi:MAG: protein-L-isoaspartate O-methyltransferase [Thermoplasmata archaeon]